MAFPIPSHSRNLFWACLFVFLVVHPGSIPCPADSLPPENCRDHPLISGMPNFFIEDCRREYDIVDIVIGKDKNGDDQVRTIEGLLTQISYYLKVEAPQIRVQDIMNHYRAQFQAMGCDLLYEEKDLITAVLSKQGKQIYFSLIISDGEIYELSIVEPGIPNEIARGDELLERLNVDGYIVLYLSFSAGIKAIETDSLALIDGLAHALNADPDLKISIEGHMDDTDNPERSRALSLKKAERVREALAARGIDVSRMALRGWGSDIPIADNRKAEGRKKNGRVEIIKQ